MYDLKCVVVHKGTLAYAGHYIADIKSAAPDGRPVWKEYDDSLVTPVDLPHVLRERNLREGYIFMYTRRD